MNLIVSILYLIAIVLLFMFSSIAIKHAARFRYLSSRTVYLTLFYVAGTAVLFVCSLAVLIWIIVY